jgi:hypothetical protein
MLELIFAVLNCTHLLFLRTKMSTALLLLERFSFQKKQIFPYKISHFPV